MMSVQAPGLQSNGQRIWPCSFVEATALPSEGQAMRPLAPTWSIMRDRQKPCRNLPFNKTVFCGITVFTNLE